MTDRELERREHVLELTVTHEHLDEYGHVNNVVYLRWIEECVRSHAEAGRPRNVLSRVKTAFGLGD